MLAVAIELLADRYTATRFNDWNRPEWPPHPARLFSAMVAAWGGAVAPTEDEADALRWFEALGPPHVACARPESVRQRAVVTHFVPVNDDGVFTDDGAGRWSALLDAEAAVEEAASGEDQRQVKWATSALVKAQARVAQVTPGSSIGAEAFHALPSERRRRGRTYPTVVPDVSTVVFTWTSAEPDGRTVDLLDGLLARVGRLGHSSTFVSCRVLGADPPVAELVPADDADVDVMLRVPRRGSLRALVDLYASHQGSDVRTMPAGTAGYRWRGPRRMTAPRPLLGGEWYVLQLPEGRTLGLARTLDLTRAVRGALLQHGPQPAPSVLSGHEPGRQPTRPVEAPHVAVVPLASVQHAKADGSIRGIAVIVPRDVTAEERVAVDAALIAWRDDVDDHGEGFALTLPNHRGEPWRLRSLGRDFGRWDPTSTGGSLTSLRRWSWTRPSRRWVTVTPIALDRVPGRLGSADDRRRRDAEAHAAATVVRACGHAGLPVPSSVEVRLDPPLVGVPGIGSGARPRGTARFPAFRSGTSGVPRVCIHASLEFDEPVGGPVLLGAGRYLGYGLCLPLDRGEP